jgi:hypothetical protein
LRRNPRCVVLGLYGIAKKINFAIIEQLISTELESLAGASMLRPECPDKK